jgi:hypothetical protein
LTVLGGNDDNQGLDGIAASNGTFYVLGFTTKALLDFWPGGTLGILDQAFCRKCRAAVARQADRVIRTSVLALRTAAAPGSLLR